MNLQRQEDRDALRQRLEAVAPGLDIEIVASTGSTSSDLIEQVRAHEPAIAHAPAARVRPSIESRAFGKLDPPLPAPFGPVLRVAGEQTAGRGRRGRTWQSRAGASLTFSLAWPLTAQNPAGLSLAVGVALADALEPLASGRTPRIGLKWPNDLWLLDAPGSGRKLGGVLIEIVSCQAERIAIIGVGLNLRGGAASGELSTGYASLEEFGSPATAPAVLAQLVPALVSACARFESSGLHAFLAGFAQRDAIAGYKVQTSGMLTIEGTADGIDADGALRLRRSDGTVERIASGEVSVRVTPGPQPHRASV